MNQDRFVGIYVDVLNATVSEAIQKNLVLQAQVKIAEEEKSTLQKTLGEVSEQYKKAFQDKDIIISELQSKLDTLNRDKEVQEIEQFELKKSSQHISTFKNELSKARTEIERLNTLVEQQHATIAELRNTKSKKAKQKDTTIETVVDNSEQQIKDAGNF